MVGQGLEPPSIVKKLLDIHIVSQKPQYLLASEEPLLLYDCVYQDLNFIRSQNVYNLVSKEISSEISRYALSDFQDCVMQFHTYDHKLNIC